MATIRFGELVDEQAAMEDEIMNEKWVVEPSQWFHRGGQLTGQCRGGSGVLNEQFRSLAGY